MAGKSARRPDVEIRDAPPRVWANGEPAHAAKAARRRGWMARAERRESRGGTKRSGIFGAIVQALARAMLDARNDPAAGSHLG